MTTVSASTPGFSFSKLVFGWGSIQIWLTWGCTWNGVLLIDSSFISIICKDFSQTLKVKIIKKMSVLNDYKEIQIPGPAHWLWYMYKYSFHSAHLFQKCQSWHRWSCIQAEVVLFQNQLLTSVLFFIFLNGVRFYWRVGLHLHGYGINLNFWQFLIKITIV